MTADSEGYGLRKRRRVQTHSDDGDAALEELLEVVAASQNIVVFSGSGLSASSGMSTFSTRGGLYERAQKRYRLADGKTLFTYAFFDRQRPEAQAFFADIYGEALRAEPAPGHRALRELLDAGRLRRHYTMNIDGLAEEAGMPTWHHEHSAQGVTVEMHGNVRRLVCPECHATAPMTAALAQQIRARQPVPCAAGCGRGAMRFKVMMYDDGEAECITPDDVMELMESDVKAADLVLWVGISFQQSASTVYFRNVRCWIQEAGRLGGTAQALVNPSDEALFNLRTAMSNQAELRVLEVLAEADDVLPLLADAARRGPRGGGARRTAPPAGRPARAAAAFKREDGGWAPARGSPEPQAGGRQQPRWTSPRAAQQQAQQQRRSPDAKPAVQALAAPVAPPPAQAQLGGLAGVPRSPGAQQAAVQTLDSLSQVLMRALQASAAADQRQKQEQLAEAQRRAAGEQGRRAAQPDAVLGALAAQAARTAPGAAGLLPGQPMALALLAAQQQELARRQRAQHELHAVGMLLEHQRRQQEQLLLLAQQGQVAAIMAAAAAAAKAAAAAATPQPPVGSPAQPSPAPPAGASPAAAAGASPPAQPADAAPAHAAADCKQSPSPRAVLLPALDSNDSNTQPAQPAAPQPPSADATAPQPAPSPVVPA